MILLNMGNWYNPLTPYMAVLLLVLSILIECPIILVCLSGEDDKKRRIGYFEVVGAVVGANVLSFLFGWLFLVLNGVL